jgi:hypothetical protein
MSKSRARTRKRSSEYDGCYVKQRGNPAYWAVDDGERRLVHSQAEMMQIGIRRVVAISEAELEAIPIAGEGPTIAIPFPENAPA